MPPDLLLFARVCVFGATVVTAWASLVADASWTAPAIVALGVAASAVAVGTVDARVLMAGAVAGFVFGAFGQASPAWAGAAWFAVASLPATTASSRLEVRWTYLVLAAASGAGAFTIAGENLPSAPERACAALFLAGALLAAPGLVVAVLVSRFTSLTGAASHERRTTPPVAEPAVVRPTAPDPLSRATAAGECQSTATDARTPEPASFIDHDARLGTEPRHSREGAGLREDGGFDAAGEPTGAPAPAIGSGGAAPPR